MDKELTDGERLMAEVAANLIAITESETERLVRPPRGPMSEVGHYHTLAKRKLRSKELDAVQQLLDDVAYNVAAMIFAQLDGKVEHDPPLPVATLATPDGEPITLGMHELFLSIWERDGDDEDED